MAELKLGPPKGENFQTRPAPGEGEIGSLLTDVVGFPTIAGMPTQYIPVFIFAVLAAAFPALSLVVFKLIRPTPVAVGAKLKPYECGVEAEGDTRGRYSVRFYIVAILFVIFDVETTFLFPWAVLFSTRQEGFRLPQVYALASMFVFLGILIVGYVWLYRKGALEWV